MRDALTKPTRGRIALWLVLAFLWFLFLPQDLAMDPDHKHFSWPGAVFWALVLVWLVVMAIATYRRRRARSAPRAEHPGLPSEMSERVPATRHYRVSIWPLYVLVPFTAVVAVAGLISDHTAPAVLVPIVVLLAAAWIYAARRSGLYVTDSGVESRMTRRENSFRFSWPEIDHFELVSNDAQMAIVMCLADGKRLLLPSTRAWR